MMVVGELVLLGRALEGRGEKRGIEAVWSVAFTDRSEPGKGVPVFFVFDFYYFLDNFNGIALTCPQEIRYRGEEKDARSEDQ
jgi:hypothetical protein